MLESKNSGTKLFDYEAEKEFYGRQWPEEAKPYLHLEQYLRCWFDPEVVFSEKRVLDIGAGELTYTRLIADRFGPKEIVACELFRERMLPAWRANRNSKLKAVAGDCFHLPFQNHSFDVVIATLILCELPRLQQVLLELRRVLKTGGIFVGWEPNPFNPVIFYRYLFGERSPNEWLYWPSKVRRIFRDVGFNPTIRFFYAKIPWARNRLMGTCIGILADLRTK